MKRSLFLTAALLCFSGCDSPESRYKAALETFRIEEERLNEIEAKMHSSTGHVSEFYDQSKRYRRAKRQLEEAEKDR